jgi:hypothetical protein
MQSWKGIIHRKFDRLNGYSKQSNILVHRHEEIACK